MEESYIKDYQIKLLEDTYNYNQLTTCLLKLQKIIEEEDKKQTIPSF